MFRLHFLGSSLVIRLQWAPSVLTPACCQGQVRDDTGAGSQWLRQQATLWWSVTQTSKHWVDLVHQSPWSVRTATRAVWICRVVLKGSSPMPAHSVKKKKNKKQAASLSQPATKHESVPAAVCCSDNSGMKSLVSGVRYLVLAVPLGSNQRAVQPSNLFSFEPHRISLTSTNRRPNPRWLSVTCCWLALDFTPRTLNAATQDRQRMCVWSQMKSF